MEVYGAMVSFGSEDSLFCIMFIFKKIPGGSPKEIIVDMKTKIGHREFLNFWNKGVSKWFS